MGNSMSQDELLEAARRQPFRPFRVTLTTGATFDVRHPELFMVGRRSAIIGIAKDAESRVYDRTMNVDLLHIVALEDLPVSEGTGGARNQE
jgi:hypothetical protein